jgi:fatty-acyl-CoA synthase
MLGPETTAAAIREGRVHTGDSGDVDAEVAVRITDRWKDVIITGGESVSAIEVEHRLLSRPAVRRAAAIAAPSASGPLR